jgi:hypothetical protein
LIDVALKNGITTSELQLAFVLEQIEKISVPEEAQAENDDGDAVHTHEDLGHLQIIFNNASKKLALHTDVIIKSSDMQNTYPVKEEPMIHYNDKISVSLKLLGDLNVIGINPNTLIQEITCNSSEKKLLAFATDPKSIESLNGDKIKLNHEFQRIAQWNKANENHQHAMLQMDFESFFTNTELENKFNHYCWRENMPISALQQVHK